MIHQVCDGELSLFDTKDQEVAQKIYLPRLRGVASWAKEFQLYEGTILRILKVNESDLFPKGRKWRAREGESLWRRWAVARETWREDGGWVEMKKNAEECDWEYWCGLFVHQPDPAIKTHRLSA